MKKILLTALLSGLISSSAMAAGWVDGTVVEVGQYPNGTNIVVKRTTDDVLFVKAIDSGSPYIKEILAIALTAKASSLPVEAYVSGANTWTGFKIK